MTDDFNDELASKLKELYSMDETARKLFDWTAGRKNDASETTIDRISNKIGVSRGEAVSIAKTLEAVGCGEFVVGRRGSPSRFVWAFSCISLGKAAAGESSQIEAVADAVPDDEDANEDKAEIQADLTHPPVTKLTIQEAKRGLAATLGVELSNIEITIKA